VRVGKLNTLIYTGITASVNRKKLQGGRPTGYLCTTALPLPKNLDAGLQEINAEVWEMLKSDTSRPFEKPKSGRIAVKVINHLGDEVMKVFRV
jgi:hypothetical protein